MIKIVLIDSPVSVWNQIHLVTSFPQALILSELPSPPHHDWSDMPGSIGIISIRSQSSSSKWTSAGVHWPSVLVSKSPTHTPNHLIGTRTSKRAAFLAELDHQRDSVQKRWPSKLVGKGAPSCNSSPSSKDGWVEVPFGVHIDGPSICTRVIVAIEVQSLLNSYSTVPNCSFSHDPKLRITISQTPSCSRASFKASTASDAACFCSATDQDPALLDCSQDTYQSIQNVGEIVTIHRPNQTINLYATQVEILSIRIHEKVNS